MKRRGNFDRGLGLVWAYATCACLTFVAATTQAAPHIRLKGRAQLDVHFSRESGALVISGAVTDDAARPLPNARVGISVTSGADAQGPPIALASATPEGCSGFGSRYELDGASRLILQADNVGRFCTRLSLAGAAYVARVEAYAAGFVDGSKIEAPVDVRLAPVNLRFDPEARARQPVSLDGETLSVEAVASIEDEGATSPATGISLALSNETGAQLGTATTNASGHATFKIEPVRLGEPGLGELRVSFAGNETASASMHAMRVERRSVVELAVREVREKHLLPVWEDDDVAVRVVATPGCARRGCKQAPSGTIEARLDGKGFLSAAPLIAGVARLVLPPYPAPLDGLAPPREKVTVGFRFLPDAPWFQAANEFVLAHALREPSPWRRMPLALAAIAVLAWLVFVRLPLGGASANRGKVDALLHVQLVRPAPSSHGWTGVIADAHDGLAVVGARVSIERPNFTDVEVLAQTSSDARGAFALQPIATRLGDELVAEGPLHSRLRRALPPAGELVVALVLRKRALLDRLVDWARRQGTPYDRAPEPTPRHVRQAAGANGTVVRWANAVEITVYGGALVDERVQAQVDSLAPPSQADDVDAAHPRSL